MQVFRAEEANYSQRFHVSNKINTNATVHTLKFAFASSLLGIINRSSEGEGECEVICRP
jgi:hypothetical protein